jgi:hypothetical protein
MCNLVNLQGEIKAILNDCTGTPTAKLIALLNAAGITSSADVARLLGVAIRTVQHARKGAKSATHCANAQPIAAQPIASDATHCAKAQPIAPHARVLVNNKLTNLEDSSVSEVKKDICAVLPLPTNPRAKGTNPRQAGSSDELGVKFEQFWSIFPAGRKRAKGKCRSIFVQIARGGHYQFKASADEMIDAARRYASTKPDSKYVPMPLTWLNQGRWEDDATQAEAPATQAKVEYHYPAWYLEEMASMNGGRA